MLRRSLRITAGATDLMLCATLSITSLSKSQITKCLKSPVVMRNFIAASVVLLLTAYTYLPSVTANTLLLSRLQKSPAFQSGFLPNLKRIKLGTFLRKHQGQFQVNSRYLSPAKNPSLNPGVDSNNVLPAVNFTNMDGVLLNMLMRRMSR